MVENYNHFLKQPLAYHWALIEMKCLTMNQQVTPQPELLYVSCLLSDQNDFTGEYYFQEMFPVLDKLFKRKEK